MKKSVLFLLAIFVMVFVAKAQDDPEELQATAKKAVSTAPTLDADIEDCWGTAVAFEGYNDGAVAEGDADLSGSWYAVWDDAGLYVAVDIKDDVLDWGEDNMNDAGDGFSGDQWMFDNVEIFVNPTGERNADDNTYATANASQIRYNPLDGTAGYNNTGGGYCRTDTELDLLEWVAEEVSGGYILETLIPWAAILPDPTTIPEKIGFTVNVGDSDLGADGATPASRESILLWVGKDLSDLQWNNINYFGLLNLSTDDAGCGVDGIDKNVVSSLNLYPNPATNMVTVNNVTEDITVYNSIGQVVLTVSADASTVNVDVSGLAAGIYVFQSGNSMSKVLVK